MNKSNFDLFLSENRISNDVWVESNFSWDELELIGVDYEKKIPDLESTAALLANTLQRIGAVHSVRWRIKSKSHLLAKIVRKRAEGNEKYKNISIDNCSSIITDLIGIRAIHLFKSDFLIIHEYILSSFLFEEQPVVYIRAGDDEQFSDKLENIGFLVKSHPNGYRSIHYVVATQPLKNKILVELQVRTIFEEGWSEIDHIVRYPNYSNDVQLAYLLTIFNRMSGSADEMGGFIKILANDLNETKTRLENVVRERDQSVAKAEAALEQLEVLKGGPVGSDQIKELKTELSKLKVAPAPAKSTTSALSDGSFLGMLGISGEAAASLRASFKALEEYSRSKNVTMSTSQDLSGVNSARKALEDLGGANSARKALEDLGGANSARKALEDLGGANSARKALEDLSGANSARKALEDLSGAKSARKAMEDLSAAKGAVSAIQERDRLK